MMDNVVEIKTEYGTFVDSNKELIYDILMMTDEINRQKKLLEHKKSLLLGKMNSANIPSVVVYGKRIVRIDCSSYSKLDTKKFKKDFPQLFERYSETIYKEEYITIRGAGKNAQTT